MSKDIYSEICVHFGIDSVKYLVANRRNRLINNYAETDDYLCRTLRCSGSFVWLNFFIAFV